MTRSVRVLLVDDSQLCRRIIRRALEEEPGFDVLAEAADGEEAVRLTARLRPDVVIMDVLMPRMNGLDALAEIMAASPTPVLVLSGDPGARGGTLAYEALRRGAVELRAKDPNTLSGEGRAELRDCVRFLATVPVVRHLKRRGAAAGEHATGRAPRGAASLVVIAASTGGPAALAQIFASVSPTTRAGFLVVQHLPPGFVEGLARWLDRSSPIEVRVAAEGDSVRPAVALLAPDGASMVLDRQRVVRLEPQTSAVRRGHSPSADALFESTAKAAGRHAVGVVLTGMGDDGAAGLHQLRLAGARTLVQDKRSSTVYGMPRSARLRDPHHLEMSLDEIAPALERMTRGAAA